MNRGVKYILAAGIGAYVYHMVRTATSFLNFEFKISSFNIPKINFDFVYIDLGIAATNYSRQTVTINDIDVIVSINGLRVGVVYNKINVKLAKYEVAVLPFQIRSDVANLIQTITNYMANKKQPLTLKLEGSIRANGFNYPINLETTV